jgi:hypothetical protein
MNNRKTFVLVAIMDNSLFGQWSFIAPSEFAVAEKMLGDPFAYENVFWGLRLNLGQVGDMDPRKLLDQIHRSNSQPRALVVYHLFEITPVVLSTELVPSTAANV